MKLNTNVLEETFALQLNWSFSEHTVACAHITIEGSVTVVCLCKIIEKSVIGESFVFCPARLDP